MDGAAPSLEEALASASAGKKFPAMAVVQQRYLELANAATARSQTLAQRVVLELDGAEMLKLFPVAQSHQQLTLLIQQKLRCLGRGREYLEPEERRLLESNVDSIDQKIQRVRHERQKAPPHALLKTFAQLVLTGDIGLIVEFGACLNEWKQSKLAPLLEKKLALRKAP